MENLSMTELLNLHQQPSHERGISGTGNTKLRTSCFSAGFCGLW